MPLRLLIVRKSKNQYSNSSRLTYLADLARISASSNLKVWSGPTEQSYPEKSKLGGFSPLSIRDSLSVSSQRNLT
ncbi:hypothetical protein SprV_0200574500 [Sparganum proliferum]